MRTSTICNKDRLFYLEDNIINYTESNIILMQELSYFDDTSVYYYYSY